MSELVPQRVVCAANRHKMSGIIVCGARHFDSIMRQSIEAMRMECRNGDFEQGFIDQFGQFLTREEAHVIATERQQFFRRFDGDERTLYSENLY